MSSTKYKLHLHGNILNKLEVNKDLVVYDCHFTEQKGVEDRLQTTHSATSGNNECNCGWKGAHFH